MTFQNAGQETPITASTWMPWPIRLMLGSAGAFAIIISLWELGPALWPLSFLTLFFGIIVFGAFSVGGAFIAAAVFSPSVYWDVTKGKLLVRLELHGKTSERTFYASDFISLEVKAQTDNDGPDAYSLVGHLTQEAQARSDFNAAPKLHLLTSVLWSPFKSTKSLHKRIPDLQSPNFSSSAHAQEAWARLMQGKSASPCL